MGWCKEKYIKYLQHNRKQYYNKTSSPLGISFVQAVGPFQMADAADPPAPRRGRIRAWHEPQRRARPRRPLATILR